MSINSPDKNYTKFLPLVKTRGGDFLFVPGFIYQSLLKETALSKANAKKVTEQVVRFLISANLKLITAPLIREVTHVQLLKLGFEKERLQYTRIGFPYYDLKLLLKTAHDDEQRNGKIVKWIMPEFNAVYELIKERG